MRHALLGAIIALAGSFFVPQTEHLFAIPEDNCTYHSECKAYIQPQDEWMNVTKSANFDNSDGTCWCPTDDPDCTPENNCYVSFTLTITPLPGYYHWANNTCNSGSYSMSFSAGTGCDTSDSQEILVFTDDECAAPVAPESRWIWLDCLRMVLQTCGQRTCPE